MEDSEYLTIEQTAKRYQVSVSTVRVWIRSEIVPYLKLGGVYRLKPTDVEAAFRLREKEAKTAPQQVTAVLAPDEAVEITPDQDM